MSFGCRVEIESIFSIIFTRKKKITPVLFVAEVEL